MAAVEFDNRAMTTHRSNFPGTIHLEDDARRLSGADLLRAAGLRRGQLSALIGGPPCQGFSPIGQRQERDPRNGMFRQFMRLVAETNPAIFLAENVPGILEAMHKRKVRDALALLPRSYEILDPFTVSAGDYGAPTSRSRVIFFGYDPRRVDEIDVVAFERRKAKLNIPVRTALHGLPLDIQPHWIEEEDSWRRVLITKAGPFFERVVGVIPDGMGEPVALDRYANDQYVHGNFGTRHSKPLIERYGALDYGETDELTKSVRLDPNGLCPTLRAGTGPDKGSFQAVRPIHYLRPRVITPREAARLQGFPDWFRFDRTKWHSFRQIGNSVSPILAERLLRVAADALHA